MLGNALITLNRRAVLGGMVGVALLASSGIAQAADAKSLLRAAYDNWRSDASQTTVKMTIHRPGWERKMTMISYTRGEDDALVRFIAPAKDAGNATLKLGKNTWLFNPKLNQVVKLPASLMAQPWMGSDFSYSDLARSEDVLKHYNLTVTGTKSSGGHKVHVIEAVPKRGAPVVWGKQVVKVRDDGIMMELAFYDQDMALVRTMSTDRIRKLAGRDFPVVMTMKTTAAPNEWTRMETIDAKFDVDLPNYLFTKSNLTNPRD